MTTEQQQTTAFSSPLEAYIARRLREQPLLPDAHEDARIRQRQEFTLEYEDKRRRGWLPHELARGYLDRGCRDGDPVSRPIVPAISPALEEQAARAVQALYGAFGSRAQYAISTIQFGKLEQAARGAWLGGSREIETAILEAEQAVRQSERQQADKIATEHAKVVIHVVRRFDSSPIGPYQHWGPREYRLTADEFAQLQDWTSRKEAYARGRSWEHPEGTGREDLAWPPYVVLQPAMT